MKHEPTHQPVSTPQQILSTTIWKPTAIDHALTTMFRYDDPGLVPMRPCLMEGVQGRMKNGYTRQPAGPVGEFLPSHVEKL